MQDICMIVATGQEHTTCSASNLSNFFTRVSDMLRYAEGRVGLEGVEATGVNAPPPGDAFGVATGLAWGPLGAKCPESVVRSCMNLDVSTLVN